MGNDRTTVNVSKHTHEQADAVKTEFDESWSDVLQFYAEWREPIDERIAELMDGDAEVTIDGEGLAREVAREFDYTAVAERTAARVAEELEARHR